MLPTEHYDRSYPTQWTDPPPSYDTALEEIKQERGRFNQVSTTVTSGVDNPFLDNTLLTGPKENDCHESYTPQGSVRPLDDYSVRQTQQPAPQLMSVSATSPKPTNPDEWDWNHWQHEYYIPSWLGPDCYSPRSKQTFFQIVHELSDEFESRNLFKDRNLTSATKQFGTDAVNGCKCFLDISQLYHDNVKPLTPFIRECIENGLFTRDFINRLYNL